jgi:hypothetical protein
MIYMLEVIRALAYLLSSLVAGYSLVWMITPERDRR